MQVLTHLESEDYLLNNFRVPITALEIKHQLQRTGLYLCENYHNFIGDTKMAELVLTLGNFLIGRIFTYFLRLILTEEETFTKLFFTGSIRLLWSSNKYLKIWVASNWLVQTRTQWRIARRKFEYVSG